MGFARAWLVLALSLAPVLTVASARAEKPDPARAEVLPPRIHRTASGRYVQDICPHDTPLFCTSYRLLPRGWKPGEPLVSPQAVPEGMQPSDVLAAYAVPPQSAANGAIVAIMDSPDSVAFSDLTAYRSQLGLPAIPKCTGNGGLPDGKTPCFAQVNENGAASSGTDSGADADAETGLDMDMISAGCPDCSILLVELDQLAQQDLLNAVQSASTLGAVTISVSLAGPEQQGGEPDPTGYTTPGHLVLAGTGDWGFDLVDEGVMTPGYPASAPDVVAVGGTNLFHDGSTYDEAVWNDGTFSTGPDGQDVTTSGCSTEFPMPSWQATPLAGSGCAQRATADLSAAATFTSGGEELGIVSYSSGAWQVVEGTSASTPLVAGILTRLGLSVAYSNDLGFAYTHASAFNDLGSTAYPVDPAGSSTDSQTSSCGVLCTAGPGWDGPSGVGTPNAAKLALLGTVTTDGGAPPDSGLSEDAGSSSTDAGGVDASSAADSGVSDAGAHDASPSQGMPEAAATSSSEAGPMTQSSPDGGDGVLPGGTSGCGCVTVGTGATSSFGSLALSLAVVPILRRRRRRGDC